MQFFEKKQSVLEKIAKSMLLRDMNSHVEAIFLGHVFLLYLPCVIHPWSGDIDKKLFIAAGLEIMTDRRGHDRFEIEFSAFLPGI